MIYSVFANHQPKAYHGFFLERNAGLMYFLKIIFLTLKSTS